MPEPGLRPRKKDILEKAARLFLERGYKSTSVRDIAFATGIEASSLYSHFPSKESILELLCHECADRFIAAMDAILAADVFRPNGLTLVSKFDSKKQQINETDAYDVP